MRPLQGLLLYAIYKPDPCAPSGIAFILQKIEPEQLLKTPWTAKLIAWRKDLFTPFTTTEHLFFSFLPGQSKRWFGITEPELEVVQKFLAGDFFLGRQVLVLRRHFIHLASVSACLLCGFILGLWPELADKTCEPSQKVDDQPFTWRETLNSSPAFKIVSAMSTYAFIHVCPGGKTCFTRLRTSRRIDLL